MVLFLVLGGILIFVSGMVFMGIISSSGRYKATTEAYKLGYEKGVKAEKDRIGNLIDKYTKDLEGKKASGEK